MTQPLRLLLLDDVEAANEELRAQSEVLQAEIAERVRAEQEVKKLNSDLVENAATMTGSGPKGNRDKGRFYFTLS